MKGSTKEHANHWTVALISHSSKVMFRLQHYGNHELPDAQGGFRKGRRTRHQIAKICWLIEKAREFQKNIYICFIDYTKAFTVWFTTNCGKLLRRWEYHIILTVS